MNYKKFKEIQNSLVAKGEDMELLEFIVNNIIYPKIYSKLISFPNVCNDDERQWFTIEETVGLEHGIIIPVNVANLKSNKRKILDYLIFKLNSDGWYVNKLIVTPSNISYVFDVNSKNIISIKFKIEFKKMSILRRLIFKTFRV